MTYVRIHRGPGWALLIIAFAIWSLLLSRNSPVALAGDAEDALAECLSHCGLIPGPIAMTCVVGCLAGYTVVTSGDDDTSPQFDFEVKGRAPSPPLARNVLSYEMGDRELLRVGLSEGCLPQCMTASNLVEGPADIEGVRFGVVSMDDLKSAKALETAEWTSLGEGKFNADTNTWEIPWDTTGFESRNGYILRATFTRNNGETDPGFGFALAESAMCN